MDGFLVDFRHTSRVALLLFLRFRVFAPCLYILGDGKVVLTSIFVPPTSVTPKESRTTVDGRNPKQPPGMYETL